MLQYKSSLHRYRIYKERANLHELFRENLRKNNRFAVDKLSHVPSQLAVVPSPRSMLSRDRSMPSDTWNLSGTQGNVAGNPRHMLDSSQMSYPGILPSTNQSATGGIPVQRSTGRPVVRGKNELEAQFQCQCLQGGRQT